MAQKRRRRAPKLGARGRAHWLDLSEFLVHFAVVKRTARKAGMKAPNLSGHSLRAGFVTEAAKNGADYPAIMDQTGHESLNTVHGYNRRKKKWQKPASAKLGL